MKTITIFTLTGILLVISMTAIAFGATVAELESSNLLVDRLETMPLSFTENQGQWAERVKFRADAGGASMWFTDDGVYYHFTRRVLNEETQATDELGLEPMKAEHLLIKASFVGANPDPEFTGEGLLGHKCNYFIGDDPDKWHTDVPNYSAVVVKDVYAGIDQKYYGNNGLMEYDFILSPGADPSQIEVSYDGAESVSVDESGHLIVKTAWCTVVEMAPIVYQVCEDGEYELQGSYVLMSDNTFGFQIDEEYDDAYAVRIDPVLTYGTYLGGSDADFGKDIAIDGDGSIMIAGVVYSSDFPTENPYQTFQGESDLFVAKFTNSGDALIYCTYLGGSDDEIPHGLDADYAGNAYITGTCVSTDYPTFNAYMTDQPGHDAIVTKLSPLGNTLVYSTYLGGSSWEYPGGIAVGPTGEAYVTGQTSSSDFPVENSYDPEVISRCVFVTRFTSSGTDLIYSSVMNSDGWGTSTDIAVDILGAAYIVGFTASTDYPTVNAYQSDQPGYDGFVTKMSPSGTSLEYSTYLGGNDDEELHRIALNLGYEACIIGFTSSTDFPTVNAYQTDQPGEDAVVTRLDTVGQPDYSTYLGGEENDKGYGIDVDNDGNTYVTGYSHSGDFPLVDPFDSYNNNTDVFVTKFNNTGTDLIYSTFVAGDNGTGNGYDIKIDNSGHANVTGQSWDLDVTLPGALYPTPSGNADAFLIKIGEGGGYIVGDANGSGTVDIDDVVYLIAFIFSGGPAPVPYEAGDANCSGAVDIDDVVYLIAYIFSGGPPPGDPNDDGVPDC